MGGDRSGMSMMEMDTKDGRGSYGATADMAMDGVDTLDENYDSYGEDLYAASGGGEDMDGDTDAYGEYSDLDESGMSNMSYGGKSPLPDSEAFDPKKLSKDLDRLGQDLDTGKSKRDDDRGAMGGKAGVRVADPTNSDIVARRGFTLNLNNPYGLPEVEKRGMKTDEYGNIVTNVLGLLAKNFIRKPTIKSLI